jgi:hypothetical protein
VAGFRVVRLPALTLQATRNADMKHKNILFGIGAAAALLVALLGYSQYAASSQQRNLAMQATCSDEARKYYETDTAKLDPGVDSNYTDHWNSSLGKCFVEITSSYNTGNSQTPVSNNIEIDDAIEGTLYGTINYSSGGGTPPSNDVACEIHYDTSNPVQCSSVSEFNRYAEQLMAQ